MAFGEPRLTNDIDIVAAIDEKHIKDLVMGFPSDEFYISEEMVREAIHRQGQFNIIHPGSGIKVDVILKQDTAFDNSRFERLHRIYPAESYQANFAAPEDVIIKKMEEASPPCAGTRSALPPASARPRHTRAKCPRDGSGAWRPRAGSTSR